MDPPFVCVCGGGGRLENVVGVFLRKDSVEIFPSSAHVISV